MSILRRLQNHTLHLCHVLLQFTSPTFFPLVSSPEKSGQLSGVVLRSPSMSTGVTHRIAFLAQDAIRSRHARSVLGSTFNLRPTEAPSVSVNYPHSADVGRCRAWLRFVLVEGFTGLTIRFLLLQNRSTVASSSNWRPFHGRKR